MNLAHFIAEESADKLKGPGAIKSSTIIAGVAKPHDTSTNGNTIPVTVKKPVIITGVALKQSRNKGELMEQNQDGLEYSSEEEGEDLKDTMLSIAKKGRKVCCLNKCIIMPNYLEN